MASVLRKQRILDGHHGASPAQRRISAFGRVTKPIPAARAEKRSKKGAEFDAALEKHLQAKKEEEDSVQQDKALGDRSLNVESRSRKASKTKPISSGPSAPDTPLRERKIAPLKSSRSKVTDSPTKGARAILEAFVIASPAPKFSPRQPSEPGQPLPASSSQAPTTEAEFRELAELHSAFLKALSLHYAHNGTSSPAVFSELRPSLERTWARRKVETKDIQRLLGIQQLHSSDGSNAPLPTLSLVDLGRSELGIEFAAGAEPTNAFASPLPVPALRSAFERNLGSLLASGAHLSSTLPLAPIVPFAATSAQQPFPGSNDGINGVLRTTKGARLLSEIRATAASAQAAAAISDGIATPNQNSYNNHSHSSNNPFGPGSKLKAQAQAQAAASSRGASLLERIRAKETLAASLPAGPTAEELARRSTLMKLEEVIPVIESLVCCQGGAARGGGGVVATGISTTVRRSNNSSGSGGKGMSSSAASLAVALGMSSGRAGGFSSSSSSSSNAVRDQQQQQQQQQTVSFTMGALVQHLQMSLKHPISDEEAERCVALLAGEVLPTWIQVREIGKLRSVSVRGNVGRSEWVARLMALLDCD